MFNIADPDVQQREAAIREIGETLWRHMAGEEASLFNAHYLQGRLIQWVMQDPSLKVDFFRLVDVLPTLKTPRQIADHMREYLLRENRVLPAGLSAAVKAASSDLAANLSAKALRKTVSDMAARFVVGEDGAQALPVLRELHEAGVGFTADLLGETTISHAEADAYQARYLTLIEDLARETVLWPSHEGVDGRSLGARPRANISLKLSALEPHLDAVDIAGSVSRLKARVLPVLHHARAHQVFVNLDLEQWSLHEITYALLEELLSETDFRSWPYVGIVAQAYLVSAPQDLDRLLALARRRGAPITVRLVKGAYWDYEVVTAQRQGHTCPVLTDKAATDAQYEQLSQFLLRHHDFLPPAFGSHNLRSVTHAVAVARALKLPPSTYEIQMLYGMAEPLRRALCELGYQVRVYAPVGKLVPGMAYLVRRLLENTSNQGFLRLQYHDGAGLDTLLAAPEPSQNAPVARLRMPSGDLTSRFKNCPHLDFTDVAIRHEFTRAIERVGAHLPLPIPVVVDGVPRWEGPSLHRACPSDTDRPVATVTLAGADEAEAAVEAAYRAWPDWRDRDLSERAQLLDKLADRLQAHRYDMAALQVYEVGKPWREADADVAEAIDFCRYYARQAVVELASRPTCVMSGEDNLLVYEGRGPTAVIAPWNFPLAILCGMATAALVAGNPVMLKPSEQASAVAYAFYQHLIAVGFPSEVVHFLPGYGETIGQELIHNPLVAQVAFTGSKAVGLSIMESVSRTEPGQPQLKRVICEMGGKNAIIIDDDADLDEAVLGVVRSAFGYAGQKCSACSRALVVGAAYDDFVARLVEACRSLQIQPAHDPSCQVGPVVDATSASRLLAVIGNPGKGAVPLFVGTAPAGGCYVAPAVFAVQDALHPLMQEELFGPILTVMQVSTFDEALDVALNTEYALTGAVYSRRPRHLELARRRFRVGNLYLNQGCTGALVHRQPFGGFGMSGLGTKAGGPGYLLHFAESRCVTENTMRRGFTPDIILSSDDSEMKGAPHPLP